MGRFLGEMGAESGGEELGGKRDYQGGGVVVLAMRTHMACFWLSFVVSLGGGLMLWWWDCHYHPANSHLWMVPIALILLVTPAFVWLALSVSQICTSYGDRA